MRNLIFFAFILLFWSCEMQILEELAKEPETIQQIHGAYQVTSVSKSTIQSLGKRLEKKTGFNVIESAQMRQFSDFTFDLEASQLTTDTLKRRTYTVPFLEKGDKYSTFNLIMVADSVDNVLEQYVLQYEFDSVQYQAFEQTQDLLASGVTIKRFPFSSFFNDSNPGFLERCDGIFDSNGDPVTCDEVTLNYGSGYGGGGSGGNTVWITPGGSSSGGGMSCEWFLYTQPCPCANHTYQSCTCHTAPVHTLTLVCSPSQMRLNSSANNLMQCMNCDLSDFGTPTFTLTRDATQIDNLLTEFDLSQWHMAYLSTNSAFSAELKNAFLADPNLDQNAGMFTIHAGMNGALSGNFNQAFMLSVEGLLPESEADYSQDPIRLL